MGISKAGASWEGSVRKGRGLMKPEHAEEAPFSMSSRFERESSSNPEEFLGAALAGCFSMALTAALEKAGKHPEAVRTSADVHLEREGEGFSIRRIRLTTSVTVEDLSEEQFHEIAEETKKSCPVSKALSGTQISLQAELAPLSRRAPSVMDRDG